jgi:two-component system, NtrC family, response regulator AlgB
MKGKVLLVDDEPNILKTLSICFETLEFDVTAFNDSSRALEYVKTNDFDFAFLDLKMYPIDGLQLLTEIKKISPETTVVIITAHGSIETAVEAIKKGAYDYLLKPFGFQELQHFVQKVYEFHNLQNQVKELKRELKESKEPIGYITRDQKMLRVLDLAKQIADSNLSVLIEGESGTGKELLAHYIHNLSPRKDKPFIKVNCAALPENLLESELFGHTKGAFTGAIKDREGRFQIADTGTIFLDEIAEVSKNVQVKLLRFLQDREFERVGDSKTLKVDVRVIAATNVKLDDALKSGEFREDLFFRLNPVRMKLAPLRERPEDILFLVDHFIKKINNNLPCEIDTEVLKIFKNYRWPGNIRELENVIERAVIVSQGKKIESIHLPEELSETKISDSRLKSLEELEKDHIAKVLAETADFEEAANVLQIDTTTLWRKRKKYNL